jgi:hypothetical protein
MASTPSIRGVDVPRRHSRRINAVLFALPIVLLAALVSASPARAMLLTFTDSAAFFAALQALGASTDTETYENLAPDTLIQTGQTVDGITYAFPQDVAGRIDTLFAGFGQQDLAASRATVPVTCTEVSDFCSFFFPGDSVTVTVAGPTNVFGIFFNAVTSPPGSFFATVLADNGASVGSSGQPEIGTFYFVGLIDSEAFRSVTFGATLTANSGYTVDNLTHGTLPPVQMPEPSTLALAFLGPALLASARRATRGAHPRAG